MNSKLTQFEIKDLIFRYNSELRKLEFQLYKTKETLQELQNELHKLSNDESKARTSVASIENTNSSFDNNNDFGQSQPFKPEFDFPEQASSLKKFSETPQEKKKRGRPKKNPSLPKPIARTTEPIRSTSKGYRLSDWDKFIIESLDNAKRVLINADFLMLAREKTNNRVSESELKGKLTRSIHKLANKRGDIVKIDFSGKGYAYALKDWINPKGMLKRKYAK